MGRRYRHSQSGAIFFFASNAKVSDASQPPVTFDLSLSESAGSRSLYRLVRPIHNSKA
jgi:hypothetical protein